MFDLMFPMAGQGVRFGRAFKPFLHIGDETFIEAAARPFRRWKSLIRKTVFVYLQEQEQEFSVYNRLREMFPDLDFEVVRLPVPTIGPAETLGRAVEILQLSDSALVCDCDHSIDIHPLIERIVKAPPSFALLPIWDIAAKEASAWSVVSMDLDGTVISIAEKEISATVTRFAGVIGCYYFRNIRSVAETALSHGCVNLSEVLRLKLMEGERIETVRIRDAEFFGDPERLERAIEKRKLQSNERPHRSPIEGS